ncbi:Striated muscle preferentially expressed protein kinase [Oryzias melastigma]|uniref:non-specific serine/threonine protein kinase n=1 Tax=Oryzias melastigma TaxID=30732 RepID=A0A834L231_ORYME|nr:Striated muscle preferentially expressed protein kinase [Oryzias melastigma]
MISIFVLDSESTDDEGGDQLETKGDSGDVEGQTAPTMMERCGEETDKPHGQEYYSTRNQSEVSSTSIPQVLPPPSPRLVKRISTSPMPSRSGSTTPVSSRKKIILSTEYQDTVPGEFEEKVKQPKAVSQTNTTDTRPQTPQSDYSRKDFPLRPSPKLTRASSKVFEKVRGLEERRRSLDLPEASVSGRSWAGFNLAGSVDSDDGGSRLGISRESSREDLREALKEDAAERRSMFRQRAASLEDKPRYTQKVQDIENKFTEELQRIKKLVGKPHMKKSFSTEQLTLKSKQRQPFRKIEPIPPQVLHKLQERERMQWAKEKREKELAEQPQQTPQQTNQSQFQNTSNIGSTSVTSSRHLDAARLPESMQLSDLPGQRLVRELHRVSPVTEIIQRSSSPAFHQQQREGSPIRNVTEMTLRKVERRPPSPLVQRVTRMQDPHLIQESAVQSSQKTDTSGRKTPVEVALRKIENRPESPLVQKRTFTLQDPLPQQPPKTQRASLVTPTEEKMELELTKAKVPRIVVEEERMEVDVPVKTAEPEQKTTVNQQHLKTKGKTRRTRPMSPELDSSDDSYVSAEEDPMEAPVFEFPLQDTVASAGADVLLKTIIAGTPIPTVTWTKDNIDVSGFANFLVKVEGERHSLLIKSAKTSDAGKYCVTAVNQVGKASCCGTVVIEPKGTLGLPRDISSPITSDEEYLSPLEEAMDFGVQEPRRTIDSRFRQPPAFMVTMADQSVIEGQEVTMSVRISGQPKPMLYWLRDRVTVKTGPRHIVRETTDGTFEMTIKLATRSDTGIYTCRIINEYGTKQCEARLEVKAPPIEPSLAIVRPVRDITAKAGETVLFECHVVGPKDTDVDWLADGKLIQPALLNCKMHFDGRKCRLLLNSVHEDDSGTYMCKLSTAKEELTSSGKLKVIPSLEPLFTRKLDILEVIEGRNARFDCKISGTPPPKVIWSHFDQSLIESEDIRILQEGGRHSLVISHVTSQDEGLYTIIAQNCHGEAESSSELYIQEPRPAISSQLAKLEKMPSIPEEPEVPENEVERFTMPDFIRPLYDLDFTDVHSLVIRSVCHAHGGVYKSVISNKIGKATCYAHLYVTDILPDPPDGTPVIESITGKTITLSWKKPRRLDPSIDPSSLMYAIQQQALGSIQWTIIASGLKETIYTITTLSKSVRYAFRVLTITSKAFSKPSPATDPVQLLDRGSPYLQEAPVIVDKPDVVYVIENQSVTISININHVNATVTWKRKGVTLANKPSLYEMTMPDDDQHTLKLLKVKSTDVGEMTFVASNEYGSDSCTFIVEMAAPPTFETIMEDLDVCSGETPRFAVVVEGKPIPDILWFKGDNLLSESSHYTFVYDDNECSLVVLNAHPEDSGVYTCTARNLAGSVSCKAELTVHEGKSKSPRHKEDSMEDEESILRKMRRLTDYYDIHKEIGRGAFSYVKRVTHKGSKMEYVAKFISTRAKKKTSSLREMNLLSRLDHERVIYFQDAFEKKNAVIIITEKCHEELFDRFIRKSAILESDVRSSIRQLLEGLDYLHHQNIIHLDIKPENILMADPHSDQIRICDFGNAVEIKPDEAQYCKYGTPEFVAPEIVNQSPVSKATDICLTGISPFAGENDRSSVLNIRNYNVAFEETMFADLCREAKGFIIKLLVADRLRPDSQDCLRHPWFKMLSKGKAISTEALKKFVSRRKWQRSIISYKSKMVMRSIPELLNDSSSHVSIAVPRQLKDSSALPSSSSDSDEDIDELPFIPMPVNMEFSRSWMSLTDIQSNEGETGKPDGTSKRSESSGQAHEAMECDSEVIDKKSLEVSCKDPPWKRPTQEKEDRPLNHETNLPEKREQARKPLKRGSSVESDKAEGGRRKGELRRGGSADSALMLRIPAEEGTEAENREDGRRVLKKAVSMELPRRSTSPGTAKMSQEDYALKLELMRQRLLRGGSVDNKMSGLRGPLLETLGMGDEKRVVSSRTARLGPPPLTRAASSDFPRDDVPKPKILRKSTSFSQGDSEPIPLHRRSGAPLEIPVTQVEERKLKEAISMSALTEQIKFDSRPVTPRDPSPKPPTPESVVRESPTKTESDDYLMEKEMKTDESMNEKMDGLTTESNFDERSSTSGFSERDMSISEEPINESEYMGPRIPTPPPVGQSTVEKMEEMEEGEKKQEMEEGIRKDERNQNVDSSHEETTKVVVMDSENKMDIPVKTGEMSITTSSVFVRPTQEYFHSPGQVASTHVTPSVPARVVLPDGRMSAYASIMQTIMVPAVNEPTSGTSTPVAPSTTLSSVFPEASSQVSVSSHMPVSLNPVVISTTEHPAVYSRVASPEVLLKEPTPPKTLAQSSPQQEVSAGTEFEDITSEEVFEARFKKRESSLSRSLKFLSRSKNDDKSQPVPPDSGETHEEIYRPRPVGAPLEFAPRRFEKSKSVQDLREAQKDQGFMRRLSMRLKRTPSTERKDDLPKADDSAASSRRLSWTLGRRGSQEKKEGDTMQVDDQDQKEVKKPSESPVLAMRRKIESTVAGISTRIRSYSEERRTSEEKETKRTPIFSMLRRSTSESRAMKVPLVPQNQLASQAQNGASSESLDSMSSLKSDTSKGVEGERRSRWDRWGLTRGRRDKTISQPDIPTAIYTDNSAMRSNQYSKLASDFPPVFHIKLRDHVLLEGDPVTLSCLPAGSPHPHISWQKDKKPLEIDARMNMISCPDGRQLLMIMQTTKKDAGVYECVATNPLASVSSSCTISLARDNNWLIVATGVADCYYNVTDLPAGGSFRFRVACVNKAGQGPYSNLSEVVHLDSLEPPKTSSAVVVKTAPAAASAPPVVMMSSMKVPPMKPAPPKSTTVTNVQPVPPPSSVPAISVSKPASPVTIKPAVQVAVSQPPVTLSVSTISTQQAPVQTTTSAQITPPKAKTTISISVSKPQLKPPPIVPPKPQSPIHAFPSVTHSPPSPEPSPAPAIGKPISSLPMYVPTATSHVTPPPPAVSPKTPTTTAPAVAPVTISPPVVVVQSLTPVVLGGDSRSPSSGRVTPTGRVTPSGRRTPLGKPGDGSLRQGVPQKPYTFMDEKARGRFGVIRECRENATGNLFLAKIVPYEADSKQAVLQEYDILKSLHHDRIMALHEAYVTPRYLVLISEYCSGKELLYSLTERFRYSEDDVVTYIVQVLQGLDYLHTRRILHLDIKPENIIVTHMNIIKIIDFGSSQTYNPLFLKQFSPPIGTLEYMSPEMLKGDVVGPPADIWSLGVVTFIMLSGRLPFMEMNPQETEAKILAAKLDLSKLYQNVSQSASLFLKKILCSYPWARPSIKDCFNNSWLQDAYLMRLRRQTLTFTTTLLKEFLAEQQRKREKEATKHKVLLRSYQSSPQTPTSTITPTVPTTPSALVTQ